MTLNYSISKTLSEYSGKKKEKEVRARVQCIVSYNFTFCCF